MNTRHDGDDRVSLRTRKMDTVVQGNFNFYT
jgi:hypothetical protein